MRSKFTIRPETRMKVPVSFHPCRHLENGRTLIPKICIYNYECWKCPFDQWLDELETRHEIVPAVAA